MPTRNIYVRNTDADPWVQKFEATAPVGLTELDNIMIQMAGDFARNGEPQVQVRDDLDLVKFTIKAV